MLLVLVALLLEIRKSGGILEKRKFGFRCPCWKMAEDLEGIWRLLNLTEDEQDSVVVDDKLKRGTQVDDQRWLVGKLLTRRPFNKDAMLRTFKVVWKISKEVEVYVLDSNMFVFKFASTKDKDKVLEGSPWSFEKKLLMLKQYDGNIRISDYYFGSASFWVRIYGLPLKLMNVETAKMLGRKIGTFIRADHDNARAEVGRFLRVRIEIDINKPLRRFITLKTKGTHDVHRGRLSYERLPIFC